MFCVLIFCLDLTLADHNEAFRRYGLYCDLIILSESSWYIFIRNLHIRMYLFVNKLDVILFTVVINKSILRYFDPT